MQNETERSPESYIAHALALAVNSDKGFIDVYEILKHVPKNDRPKIETILSDMAHEAKELIAPFKSPILSKETKDIAGLLSLEERYAEAVDTQKTFQLLKPGEQVPEYEDILKTFTPEMLLKANSFQDPTFLLLTKGRSFNDIALAASNTGISVNVDRLYNGRSARRQKNWGACFVDGSSKMDIVGEFDDEDLEVKSRLGRFSAYKKFKNMGGMDRLKYIHLVLSKLKMGTMPDEDHWTVLDSDPLLSGNGIPYTTWNPYDVEAVFDWVPSMDKRPNLRFRRSVGPGI